MFGIEQIVAGSAMTLLGFVVKAILDRLRHQDKVISNHMQHSTVAITEVASAVRELVEVVRHREK